jgi:hypothetical protein
MNINLAQLKQKGARVTRNVGAKERRQVFFPPKILPLKLIIDAKFSSLQLLPLKLMKRC